MYCVLYEFCKYSIKKENENISEMNQLLSGMNPHDYFNHESSRFIPEIKQSRVLDRWNQVPG